MPNSQYGSGNGSSQATAHVSGVAGLLLSYWNSETKNDQNLVQEDVEYLLSIGAEDIDYQRPGENAVAGYDGYTGWGLIQADRALKYIEAPDFDLQHIITTATAQDVSTVGTDVEIILDHDYCATGIAAGVYIADVYKVEVSTSHNWSANRSIHYTRAEHPGYWVLNSVSNLWDYDETSKVTHGRTGVQFTSGGHPDASGATLVGYYFYIKEKKRWRGNKTINTWYPHNSTDNHVLAYSVHLSRGWNLSVDETSGDFSTHPNPAQQVLNIQGSHEAIESIEIYSINGQLQEVVTGINAMNYQYLNQKQLKGLYLVSIQGKTTSQYAKVVFE